MNYLDGGFNVPDDKLSLLNKSLDRTWQRTPPEHGGGVAAMMWGFHQLHCLVSNAFPGTSEMPE